MSTPGVGLLVALTYVAAIDDPAGFTQSKSAGANFGLTPKKYQFWAHSEEISIR
jgi:transposase